MREEYELEKMESRKNPYARRLKKRVTLQLDEDVVAYFIELAEETGIPHQNVMSLYLRNCVLHHKKLSMSLIDNAGKAQVTPD